MYIPNTTKIKRDVSSLVVDVDAYDFNIIEAIKCFGEIAFPVTADTEQLLCEKLSDGLQPVRTTGIIFFSDEKKVAFYVEDMEIKTVAASDGSDNFDTFIVYAVKSSNIEPIFKVNPATRAVLDALYEDDILKNPLTFENKSIPYSTKIEYVTPKWPATLNFHFLSYRFLFTVDMNNLIVKVDVKIENELPQSDVTTVLSLINKINIASTDAWLTLDADGKIGAHSFHASQPTNLSAGQVKSLLFKCLYLALGVFNGFKD